MRYVDIRLIIMFKIFSKKGLPTIWDRIKMYLKIFIPVKKSVEKNTIFNQYKGANTTC